AYTNTQGSGKPGGIDVRLTQLRNLLAGTRPQPNPNTASSTNPLTPVPIHDSNGNPINGDANSVFGSWSGGQFYFMPNGIADIPGGAGVNYPDIQYNPVPGQVAHTTPAVPGRWGESQSIPGVPLVNNSRIPPGTVNLLQPFGAGGYTNPVRAGISFDVSDLI